MSEVCYQRDRARRRPLGRRRGFTLIEVLATLMLLAIVLPTIMRGIDMAGATASASRRRAEAAGLAESQLNQIMAGQQWQSGQMSGDFAPDWPDYRWQATVTNWQPAANQVTTTAELEQIDLTVTWQFRGRDESLTLSTLTYLRTLDSDSSTP